MSMHIQQRIRYTIGKLKCEFGDHDWNEETATFPDSNNPHFKGIGPALVYDCGRQGCRCRKVVLLDMFGGMTEVTYNRDDHPELE